MKSPRRSAHQVGPSVIVFETDDAEVAGWIERAHPSSRVDAPPDLTVRIVRAPLPDRPYTLSIEHDGDVERIARHTWEAVYDPSAGHAELTIDFPDHGITGDQRLRWISRTLAARQLVRRECVVFHAAALIRDGQGFLFCGPSGSGKTTLATRWPADAVLGDDSAAVARCPDGWRLYSTPYSGREGTPNRRGNAPLAGIFLLEQAPEEEAIRVPVADACRALIRNAFDVGPDPIGRARQLDTIASLLTEVPVMRLRFGLHTPVWPTVMGALT